MEKLSTLEVAEAIGKSKQTVLRLVSSGKISAERIDGKTFSFDKAEVMRLYPDAFKRKEDNSVLQHGATTDDGLAHHAAPSLLRLKLDFEKEKNEKTTLEIEELKNKIKSLEEKNDLLQSQNNKLTDELVDMTKRLLPAPEEKKEAQNIEPPKRKKFLGLF